MPIDPNDPLGLNKLKRGAARKAAPKGLSGSLVDNSLAPVAPDPNIFNLQKLNKPKPKAQPAPANGGILDSLLHPKPAAIPTRPHSVLDDIESRNREQRDEIEHLGERRAKPKKLSGSAPNPSHEGDAQYYGAQLPDRIPSPAEKKLRDSEADLISTIRQHNAQGYDVSGLQKSLFDVHEALKKFGGNIYKSPPDKQLSRNIAAANPSEKPASQKLDPYSNLGFLPEDFQHSIDHGLSSVPTQGGGQIPIAKAMQMAARATGQKAFRGVEDPEHVEQSDNGAIRNMPAELDTNPHRVTMGSPEAAIQQFTGAGAKALDRLGITRKDAPYAYALSDFLGGTAAFPYQVFNAIDKTRQDPVGAISHLPSTAQDFINSINVFDPNVSGPDRFGRLLNAIPLVLGGVHGGLRLRSLIQSGEIYKIGERFGLPRERAQAMVEHALSRQPKAEMTEKVPQFAATAAQNVPTELQPIPEEAPAPPKAKKGKKKPIQDDPLGLSPEIAEEAPAPAQPSLVTKIGENGFETSGGEGLTPEQIREYHVKKAVEIAQAQRRGDFSPTTSALLEAQHSHHVEELEKLNKPAVAAEQNAPLPSKPYNPADYPRDSYDDEYDANERYLDHAQSLGLSHQTLNLLSQISENTPLHEAYSPETLEALARSKIKGRRQPKLLNFLAAGEIESPELVDRAIKVFEDNAVHLGDRHETSENYADRTKIRGDKGDRNALDRIIDEQHTPKARPVAQPVAAPEVADEHVPPVAVPPREEAPVAATPREEPPVEQPREEIPAAAEKHAPEYSEEKPSGVKKLGKAEKLVLAHADKDGVIKSPYQWSGENGGRIGHASVLKYLEDAKTKGLVEHDPGTSSYALSERGKALQGETQRVQHGVRTEDAPEWATPGRLTGLEGGRGNGWMHNEVNGKTWHTNTHLAAEGSPKNLDTELAKQPDISRIVPEQNSSWRPIKEIALSGNDKGRSIHFSDGTRANQDYIKHVERLHPGGEWYRTDSKAGGSTRPIAYVKDDQVKGVVMPQDSRNNPAGVHEILDSAGEHGSVNRSMTMEGEKAKSGEQPRLFANQAKPLSGATPTKPAPAAPTAPAPSMTPVGKVHQIVSAIKRVFSPQSVSARAGTVADLLREHGATIHQRYVQSEHLLKDARADFDHLSDGDVHKFIDDVENGRSTSDPKLQPYADAFRDVLDTKRDEIRNLGTGKLSQFYSNYFPHLWEDPKAAQTLFERLFSKRPLQGNKNFLKTRKLPLYSDGLAAGLKPKFRNPVDMVLEQAHEMDRYILSQKLLNNLKERNLVKYVNVGAQGPEGFVRVDDNLFTRYHSGEIPIQEAFDEQIMGGLNKLAKDLGVKTSRSVKIAGQPASVWGIESKAGVETKFGGSEPVLTHEIGHALDRKLGLKKFLRSLPNAADLWTEGRKLAEFRYEGHTASRSYERYVKNQSEVVANLVHAYVHAPDLLASEAPELTKAFNDFIAKNPVLKQLKDIKPSLVLASNQDVVRAPGIHTVGHYMVPSDVGDVLNRYLQPGIQGGARELYDAFQHVNNGMNQMNLGLSGFHAIATSFNSLATELSLGLKDLSRGKVGSGMAHVGKGLSPTTVVADYLKGKDIREQFLAQIPDPRMRQIIRGVTAGGGRVGTAAEYTSQAIKAFKSAFSDGRYGTAVSKAVPALLEATGAPLMQKFVPNLKLAAFSKMLEHNLQQAGPNISEDQFRRIAAKAWDNVDDRMGQLVYDNLFWSKTARQVAQASVRSVGWNLGTARAAGGAIADLKRIPTEGISDRTGYAVALPLVVGTYGAALNYLLSKQAPNDVTDCFFPRTGRVNADGTPERLSIPSYVKDSYGFAQNPVRTVANKTSPEISSALDFLNNRDYRNTKIRNEDDPLWKQGMDVLKHTANDFAPFSLQNQLKDFQDNGGKIGKSNAFSFLGFQKAPSYIDQTPAMKLAAKYMGDMMPAGARTSEEAAKSDLHSQVVGLLRNGQQDKAKKLIDSANIKDADAKKLMERADDTALHGIVKRLPLGQALNVYRTANKKERADLEELIITKFLNAQKRHSLSDEDFDKLDSEFSQLQQGK